MHRKSAASVSIPVIDMGDKKNSSDVRAKFGWRVRILNLVFLFEHKYVFLFQGWMAVGSITFVLWLIYPVGN